MVVHIYSGWQVMISFIVKTYAPGRDGPGHFRPKFVESPVNLCMSPGSGITLRDCKCLSGIIKNIICLNYAPVVGKPYKIILCYKHIACVIQGFYTPGIIYRVVNIRSAALYVFFKFQTARIIYLACQQLERFMVILIHAS